MVKLPNLDWFKGMLSFRGEGNIYSGSAGCDPVLGNIESKVFRYRAWVEKTDDGFTLKAAHYIGLYSYDATDKSIIIEKEFEASPEGIFAAQHWLQNAEDSALESFKT